MKRGNSTVITHGTSTYGNSKFREVQVVRGRLHHDYFYLLSLQTCRVHVLQSSRSILEALCMMVGMYAISGREHACLFIALLLQLQARLELPG